MSALEGIVRRVEQLKEDAATTRPDHERLHSEEDNILVMALEAIAAGDPQSQDIAREALATQRIAFSRWYA